MVEIGPRQEGLVHISELAPWRVEKVTDILNVGDIISVRVKNIDDQGRINLTYKDVPGVYSDQDLERGKMERRDFQDPSRPGTHRGGMRREHR